MIPVTEAVPVWYKHYFWGNTEISEADGCVSHAAWLQWEMTEEADWELREACWLLKCHRKTRKLWPEAAERNDSTIQTEKCMWLEVLEADILLTLGLVLGRGYREFRDDGCPWPLNQWEASGWMSIIWNILMEGPRLQWAIPFCSEAVWESRGSFVPVILMHLERNDDDEKPLYSWCCVRDWYWY